MNESSTELLFDNACFTEDATRQLYDVCVLQLWQNYREVDIAKYSKYA